MHGEAPRGSHLALLVNASTMQFAAIPKGALLWMVDDRGNVFPTVFVRCSAKEIVMAVNGAEYVFRIQNKRVLPTKEAEKLRVEKKYGVVKG